MAVSRRDPEPIGKILRAILARHQPERRNQLEAVNERIAQALPPRYRGRVKVDSIARDAIVLLVEASPLLAELRSFHTQRILAAAQGEPGLEAVTKVRFKLGASHGA